MSALRAIDPRSRARSRARSLALVTALLLVPVAPGVAVAATTGGADLASAQPLPFSVLDATFEASNVGVVPVAVPFVPAFLDSAWFRLEVGVTGQVRLRASSLTAGFDPGLEVRDAAGGFVALNADAATGGTQDAEVFVFPAAAGTVYYLGLGADSDSVLSQGDALLMFDPLNAPGPPTDVQVFSGDGAVAVSWAPPTVEVGTITGYAVLHRPEGQAAWNPMIELAGTTTHWTITGLTNGTSYEVAVAARNVLGWGTTSIPITATPKAASSVEVHTVPAEPVLGEGFLVFFTVTSGGLPVPDTMVDVTYPGGATLSVPLEDGEYLLGSTVVAPSTYTVSLAYPGTAAIAPSSATYTKVFAPAPQTITFDPAPPAAVTFGAAPVTIGATADSGLTVTLGVAGTCALDGATLSFTGAGTCTVTATQAGDATHAPATVTSTVTIARAPTVTTIDLSYVGPTYSTFRLVVTAGGVPVGGTVTVELDGLTGTWPAGTTVDYHTGATGPHVYTLQASYNGTDDYLPSSSAVVVVDGRLTQTLDLDAALPDSAPALTTIDLPVVTSAGRPVSYLTTTPAVCTVDGSTLRLVGVGTCSVEGSNPGDAIHQAVLTGVSFAVVVGVQTVTITGVPATHTGAGTLPVTAVSSAGRPVTITTTGPCTWAAGVLSVVGTGECLVTATAPGDAVAGAATATARMTVVAAGVLFGIRLDAEPGARAQGVPVIGAAEGLRPGTPITLTVTSTPVVIASSVVDARGGATLYGSLPALAAGSHQVTLEATALDGSARSFTLAFGVGADGTITWIGQAVPGGGLPTTGADVGSAGALAALGVLTGLGLVVLRRRIAGVLVPDADSRTCDW